MPTFDTEPTITKITIDGIEIPVESLASVNDDAVTRVFEMIAAIDESERSQFILTTSTATHP